jgi:hypothetical protein
MGRPAKRTRSNAMDATAMIVDVLTIKNAG